MIAPLGAMVFVALLFYVVIPGIGAFGVRQRWRRFRRRVLEASLLMPVTYARVHASRAETQPEQMRFIGSLESIQGDSLVWVRGDDITLSVDMRESDVYVLEGGDEERPPSPPIRTTWARVGSLPAGAKLLLAGTLDARGAHPTLRARPGDPVLAVLYDGPTQTLVRRCVWSGRQLNEYWNSVTPGALAAGTFALVIISYLLLQQPMLVMYARLAIGLALVPLLPLLPPGVAVFYFYRVLWRRGRVLRAHRDVLLVPARHFRRDERCTRLANGELYCRSDADLDSLGGAIAHGLLVLTPPVDGSATRCTVFGRPGPDSPLRPTDALSEWIAVRGDPSMASQRCQRIARRYEIASVSILGIGLLANFFIAVIALGAIV